MPTNILIFIHGITPEERPASHQRDYRDLWQAMQAEQPSLARRVDKVVEVEWGNRFAGGPTSPDTLLSDAERQISGRVRFDVVEQHPGPGNVLHPGVLGDVGIPGVRRLARNIRERLVQFGLADAVYYASEDGERAVRNAIYGKVLRELREYKSQTELRLHVVAHSLGVTVAHDFLYGLFGKFDAPDYLAQTSSAIDRQDYEYWRARAADGRLVVGSFVNMASQLPLFVLRKQKLVTQLAEGKVLSPSDIGIGVGADRTVRWLVVYDVDDVLGFATRELYGNHASIRQVQVDSGDSPIGAHTEYWRTPLVVREAAALIANNT
ncbi:MAG: hypothetical protein RLZZ450_4620 [Pseudomonadota bacterium]